MTLPPKLIVFDCDGTLADSQHLIVEAMRLAFKGAGLAAPRRSLILQTVGLSMPQAIAMLAPRQPAEARDRLTQSYREWSMTLRQRPNAQEPLFEGAQALLLSLAAREGVLLGIATGKSRRGAMRFIEANGLHGIFSTIQTADDAPSKPHPGMLIQAMAETGACPGRTVMIGDTSYDMIMAASAKAASIGVGWGYHSVACLRQSGAKTIVHSFAALDWTLQEVLAALPHYGAVA